MDEIRFKEKQVTLSNQGILELAYMARHFIALLSEQKVKLRWEEANCYSSVFNLMKNLLKEVDPEYLETHGDVRDFYNLKLSRTGDVLQLSKSD